MERVLKNADISNLSNFLALFSNFFLISRNFAKYHLHAEFQRFQGGGGQNLQSLAIRICKKPGLFRVKRNKT